MFSLLDSPRLSVAVAPDTDDSSNTTILCAIDGNPDVYDIQWNHEINGTVIRSDDDLRKYMRSDKTVLQFDHTLTYEDRGWYICSASNGIPGLDGTVRQKNSTYLHICKYHQ